MAMNAPAEESKASPYATFARDESCHNGTELNQDQQRYEELRSMLLDPCLVSRFRKRCESKQSLDENEQDDTKPSARCESDETIDKKDCEHKKVAPWKLSFLQNQDDSSSNHSLFYPTASYLDIRVRQNAHFCQTCLEQGLHESKQNDTERAEAYYKQGLEVDPQHADLWVALALVQATRHPLSRHYPVALQSIDKALEFQPGHPQALLYQTQIQTALQQLQTKQSRAFRKSNKSLAALQDVQAELALEQEKGDETNQMYGLLDQKEDDDDDNQSRDRSSSRYRKKREKKSKKKDSKKKRKRRRKDEKGRRGKRRRREGYSSSLDTSNDEEKSEDDSSDQENGSSSKSREKRRKSKKRQRKRRRSSSPQNGDTKLDRKTSKGKEKDKDVSSLSSGSQPRRLPPPRRRARQRSLEDSESYSTVDSLDLIRPRIDREERRGTKEATK